MLGELTHEQINAVLSSEVVGRVGNRLFSLASKPDISTRTTRGSDRFTVFIREQTGSASFSTRWADRSRMT
jgi:hypothetical protein